MDMQRAPPAGDLRVGPSSLRNGANRDRTDDLLLAKQALSQLSYGPLLRLRRVLSRLSPRSPPL